MPHPRPARIGALSALVLLAAIAAPVLADTSASYSASKTCKSELECTPCDDSFPLCAGGMEMTGSAVITRCFTEEVCEVRVEGTATATHLLPGGGLRLRTNQFLQARTLCEATATSTAPVTCSGTRLFNIGFNYHAPSGEYCGNLWMDAGYSSGIPTRGSISVVEYRRLCHPLDY